MKNKFLQLVPVPGTWILLLICAGTMAQDRATMSAPVIRSSGGEVVISARFQDFGPGKSYRIGVGVARDQFPEIKVELLGDEAGTSLNKPSLDFVQGHTQNWWKVSRLLSRGFLLTPSEMSPAGGMLTFRLTMSREDADALDKIFVFICRNYGGDTWYLEDGTEIDQTSW